MSNYTTQTAALKAVTIDAHLLDAHKIDTKKLYINGQLLDPSQIKESPNEALFLMAISPLPDVEEKGIYELASIKLDQSGNNKLFSSGAFLTKGSQTEGALPNGVYAVIQIVDDFVKCLCGNDINDINEDLFYTIPSARFTLVNLLQSSFKLEQCIFENFLTVIDGPLIWAIKICEEDDELSELYGGITEEKPYFMFAISIPYYIPENDTPSTSTYSLRKPNLFDNLREKFEQMRQRFEERKQQNLDKSSE